MFNLSVVGTIKDFYLFFDIMLVVLLLLEVETTLAFGLGLILLSFELLMILLAVPSVPVKA
jgi:hypothetical protein